MAACEQQPQAVIRDLVHVVSQRLELGDLHRGGRLLTADAFGAEPVDRTVARGREQPRGGVARHAALRPRPERLLAGLLPRPLLPPEDPRRPAPGGAPPPPGA